MAVEPRNAHEDLAANLAALVADLRKGRAVIVFRQRYPIAEDQDDAQRRYGPPDVVVSIERRET